MDLEVQTRNGHKDNGQNADYHSITLDRLINSGLLLFVVVFVIAIVLFHSFGLLFLLFLVQR
jgi:hypothetical protein